MVRNSQTKTPPKGGVFVYPSRRIGMESASAECNQIAERELYVIKAKAVALIFLNTVLPIAEELCYNTLEAS